MGSAGRAGCSGWPSKPRPSLVAEAVAEFRGPADFVPPGASVLLASVLLAIEMAATPAALEAWCDRHHHVQAILDPAEQALAASRALRRWAVWEIAALRNADALATWWGEQQPLLRSLVADDLALVVEAKEARKARLAPPPRGLAPPAVVRPPSRGEIARAEGRLL
jgi:hypothetical protein